MKARTFNALAVALVKAALVMACLSMQGCTVTADRVKPQAASYDGGAQNSGVLKLMPDGAVVTAGLRDRYTALLEVYGKAFVPRVDPGAGVTKLPDGTFFITNDVLERMILVSEWRRMGRQPN